MKAVCGGELDGFCKGLGGVRPCPDHEKVIMGKGHPFCVVIGGVCQQPWKHKGGG